MAVSTRTYYVTKTGAVGVSIDGGDTVFNPAGRRVPLDDVVWEEVEDVSWDRLSAAAQAAANTAEGAEVAAANARAEARERRAEDLLRKRQDDERRKAEADRRRREWEASPEGKAYRARQLEASRAVFRLVMSTRRQMGC